MTTLSLLPPPPAMALHAEGVALNFSKVVIPIDRRQAPYYHFRILAGTRDVGHINLRIGKSEHVLRVVGHVGYGIRKRYRGKHYALLACQALAPFARTIAPEVIVTCDPENHASRRTLERLTGARRGQTVSVPPSDPHYRRGAR
ncbi:MAG: GNAT family N-acetyltransferase, partial [Verrucomicrobiaceae bacterium]